MSNDTRPCNACGAPVVRSYRVFPKYCSDDCKPKCTVDGCVNPQRKRTWCGSHYAQWNRTGKDPVPFKYKWSAYGPCLNCEKNTEGSIHRRFCSDNCRVAYSAHGGPRPTSTPCVACGVEIDLNKRGKGGQRKHSVVKFCGPCKQDYRKYKMSARELARRDGTDCGICGESVDMTLRRSDGLMCPSVDHVMPRSHGGNHDPENLQLAHLLCNMAKSDRVMPVT